MADATPINQIQISSSDEQPRWTCLSCKKPFTTLPSLRTHCDTTHPSTFCARCTFLFYTPQDLESHHTSSILHWICYEDDCGLDFTTQKSLDRHQEQTHAVCIPCWMHFASKDDGKTPSHSAWKRHQVEKHFMCEICGRRFESAEGRVEHQKASHTRNKPCFGCPRKFISYSAMMIHLEAGTCDPAFDIGDIDRWTEQCFPERTKTKVKGYSCAHCAELDTNHLSSIPPVYRCFSALLQHQESLECSGTDEFSHDVEQLLKFIAIRVRLLPYPAGQALAILTKLYVDNSGTFQHQIAKIEEAASVLPPEKNDERVRTVSLKR